MDLEFGEFMIVKVLSMLFIIFNMLFFFNLLCGLLRILFLMKFMVFFEVLYLLSDECVLLEVFGFDSFGFERDKDVFLEYIEEFIKFWLFLFLFMFFVKFVVVFVYFKI